MPGFHFAITALRDKQPVRLALGLFFFALAAWTRVTWFPLAVIGIPTTIAFCWRWRSRPDLGVGRCMALIKASLLLILLLLLVNHVRFGSALDFGITYQNAGVYAYYRNVRMFYSTITKLWNVLFNIMSYFGPSDMAKSLGVASRSFALYEGFPPSFFWFNPHFLPLVVLFPLALYRARKVGRRLLAPMIVLVSAVGYLNLAIGLFGSAIVLRFFAELYSLMALAFLTILLALLPPRYSLPLAAALLVGYVPEALKGFVVVRPELRTVDVSQGFANTSPGGKTPFILRPAVWPASRGASRLFSRDLASNGVSSTRKRYGGRPMRLCGLPKAMSDCEERCMKSVAAGLRACGVEPTRQRCGPAGTPGPTHL